MKNPAIVVIAYNRDESLKRLLNSLREAEYTEFLTYDESEMTDEAENTGGIPLIISIDKSDNDKVEKVANEFNWPYGQKTVVAHKENLGLKKHVLKCGDFTDAYEGIIVLEDDLFVSKSFYSYAYEALSFSRDDERIAGISLYNHLLNVHVREPFEAVDDGFDNYYMQFAQSWGQAYTKEQWAGFKAWLNDNEDKSVASDNVPVNVSTWSDKSWLKYYIKYVIDTNKFFLYPRVSLTTNFGDEGTHAESSVSDLQVPLAGCKNREYVFCSIDESESVYDAFFENVRIGEDKDITVDLYGYRTVYTGRYIISSKPLPYKVIRSYGRKLRPIDSNIINDVQGCDFMLYDKMDSDTPPITDEVSRILYNYKALNVKRMMRVIKYRIFKK